MEDDLIAPNFAAGKLEQRNGTVATERRAYLQYVDAFNWQRVTFRGRHLLIEAAGVGSTYHQPIEVGRLQFRLTAEPTEFPTEEVEALWQHLTAKNGPNAIAEPDPTAKEKHEH